MNKRVNIVLGALMIGMLSNVVLSTAILARSEKAIQMVQKVTQEEKEQETQEDDVVIAIDYTIRSTTHISDAYKNGDASSLSDRDKETLDLAKAVLDEVIEDGMSDFEKELAIYQWMTTNVTIDVGMLTVVPTSQADCDNPYGVLKYKNAVCVGYATTFRLFMQMIDIPCMVVHNTDNYHSWNLVQLDGDWYHTDIYSDHGYGNYRMFNLNDAMLSEYQTWDMNYFPAANGIKYNMAYQNGETVEDIYSVPERVREALESDQGMLAFKFDSNFTNMEVVFYIMEQIEQRMWSNLEYASTAMSTSWSSLEDGYLLAVYFQGSSKYDPENSLDSEELEKLEEVLNEVFGEADGSIVSGDYDYGNKSWMEEMYE